MDLREKIVESVKRGVLKAETAHRFGVHRATVKRYCKQLDERCPRRDYTMNDWGFVGELRKAKERLRHKRDVILGCIRQPGFEV